MIPDINLLPQRERRRAGGPWFIVTFIALFILMLTFMTYQYVTFTKNIQQLKMEEAALQSEKETLVTEVAALRENAGEDLETSIQFIEHISYPVSPLIEELNRYLDAHAYLRNYSFQHDTLSFSVDFETITDVSNYIDDLLGSPYIKDVTINGMNSFDPVPLEDGDQFKVLDRFANTFEVLIDLDYLREVDGGRR